MRKTLYSRIVFVFISISIISLMMSTFIGLYLFQQKINYEGQNSMIEKGKEMTEIYNDSQKQSPDSFFNQMTQLTSYPIHLYETPDKSQFFTLDNNNVADISQESIQDVLSGKTYRSTKKQKDTYIGFPMIINEKRVAVFLQFSYESEAIFNLLILFIIISTLILGSLLILMAARYLILPLEKLKKATELIAAGDFDVTLDLKRQDEIGELANSFNKMTLELKQIEEMRQDFVSNVSHEIQSPLTSISGFAKALKNEQLISAEQRPYYLDIIVSESDRLSRLGDNLLKLASLDSEHHPFNIEIFDVTEQIRQVILTLESQWSQKNINFIFLNETATLIEGDVDLLQQVWINLISNSIKFTPEFGNITIDLVSDDKLAATISDTGIGIPEKELSKLFQRFYKADKSRTSTESGNGLGLVIVKKIVELHHGEIQVKSQFEAGTQVSLELPLKQ
ncbi:sensor histidine kinase [Vagococcus hydrophili]|uniref:Heme sensor protein HssS n=1 Tax=Vagococcus hydrophili TaxID=2714947 RepID=A0A6G8ASA7_9ENTE|nr:HAMP domain-containing sensor histidine kinase [Vagococcus hydrophili]QIL47877.1 HAMP domain-containing protein [Vagococcus hydrophili]